MGGRPKLEQSKYSGNTRGLPHRQGRHIDHRRSVCGTAFVIHAMLSINVFSSANLQFSHEILHSVLYSVLILHELVLLCTRTKINSV